MDRRQNKGRDKQGGRTMLNDVTQPANIALPCLNR